MTAPGARRRWGEGGSRGVRTGYIHGGGSSWGERGEGVRGLKGGRVDQHETL
jgi:hypothetical protein